MQNSAVLMRCNRHIRIAGLLKSITDRLPTSLQVIIGINDNAHDIAFPFQALGLNRYCFEKFFATSTSQYSVEWSNIMVATDVFRNVLIVGTLYQKHFLPNHISAPRSNHW